MLEQCERVINKVLPACVAFHRPSFIQSLRNNGVDSVMVNALLCTAARHSPTLIQRFGRGQGSSQAAEHFGLKASNFIWLSLDHPTLADIQALCLMVIHEWGSRSAVRAYIYLGQAARMAQMYRVVHSNGHSTDPDRFLQEESFRRTLWLIYILDCFLTSSPGRFPALSALDVKDVALPCEDMNFNFGNPVYVRTLDGSAPPAAPNSAIMAPVGEFGHIVLATEAWRMVVEMMTTTTLDTFSEEQCQMLEVKVAQVRANLPHPFADRPGQMELHITMGSGVTYAMIHLLLHCAAIFINRRRILQIVTSENFSMEGWRMSGQSQMQYVERILESSHSIISMLTALERATEPTAVCCLPIFMLFSGFTAGSTVAYLALKGLSPPHTHDSIHLMVDKCLHLMKDGAESWNLVLPWHRHLSVMSRVLNDINIGDEQERVSEDSRMQIQRSPSVKDERVSRADAHHDSMDYEQAPASGASQSAPQGSAPHASSPDLPQAAPPAPMDSRDSEPPRPRPSGVTTINGGSARGCTPAALGSPPTAAQDVKPEYKPDSPVPASNGSNAGGSGSAPPPAKESSGSGVDMTPIELCAAFERQLLELDDLAAFMGGGV
ncbi:putative fungal specific transcription factor domain containing protein [Diaporthe ampelina]|uniref:Putative fungal specific transcription factor domain containing protein n=1 Tax=Diaporthe ampelina TaxID=1214573 RepID=A0A0G2F730_9PEZI|nr:putative fungal specific transcription factor domain containing protein [Diaporthe ampelina]